MATRRGFARYISCISLPCEAWLQAARRRAPGRQQATARVCFRPEADIPVWVKRLSLSITVAQRIHQQSKRRRGQTSTRVVQVVTRIRRAPIFEYAFELAFCEILQHQ